MEKEIKVAMLLYTQGLEYDDRIRKEILTLQKNIHNLRFKIYAVLPENEEKHGITDYGVEYYIPYLKSRDKYPSGKRTLLKAYDFYKTIKPLLKDFDVIWCADEEPFLFLLLSNNPKFVWDQHEIPERFIRNRLMRTLYKYLEKRCNLLYHANQPRIEYLLNMGLIHKPERHFAIRNYPENLESAIPTPDKIFKNFKKWLSDRKCIYIQGVSGKDRKCYETLTSILRTKDLCAVVVGGIDKSDLERVKTEFGTSIVDKRLYFTGKVPQKNTKLYIKESLISLVFYAMDLPNNIYCEPNRMFQSIMMGIPVIVGNNLSMKDIIDEYHVGISLDNDGSNIESINNAIDVILTHYDVYKTNVLKSRDKLCWDHQEKLLIETFTNRVLNQ